MTKSLFFIALLPPKEIQQDITDIKQHFAQVYDSRAALKSPPHITLQPPFGWEMANLADLSTGLQNFAQVQKAIPIQLQGFGAFIPKVIYLQPSKTPELLALQTALQAYTEDEFKMAKTKTRSFSPHITVAFRDLTKANFRQAWEIFEKREFATEFVVYHLTLLLHNGNKWEICQEFPFQGKMGK